MDEQTRLHIVHSSHLDLYWIGEQASCLELGAKIIDDAVSTALADSTFHFFIETARFLEYYISKYPNRYDDLKKLIKSGNIEVGACYTDREENTHDGEAMIRNVVYGKGLIRDLLSHDTRISHHPDLPGLAEQSPQIFAKCGVRYYLFSRGFQYGKRFRWRSPDGSEIVGCNFPIHYSYYNMEEEVVPNLSIIQGNFCNNEDVLISCSAGDLGPANTFISKETNGFTRKCLTDLITQWNKDYPHLHFQMDNAVNVLDSLSEEGLEVLEGESPSKWGAHGAPINVTLFKLDRQASDGLCQAEYFNSVCKMLGKTVDCIFDRNPIAHEGGSVGKRKYFDLESTPSDIHGWLTYGWRLLLVTEDHNFGGIEGAQSWFDRYIYNKAALQIAQKIQDSAVKELSADLKGDYVLFNTLNWQRDELVFLNGEKGSEDELFYLIDENGVKYPTVYTKEGWKAYVTGIPACGAKPLKKCAGGLQVRTARVLVSDQKQIRIINQYYDLSINRITGVLEHCIDMNDGCELIADENFLSIDAYEDFSNSVNEQEISPKLIDSSRNNISNVTVSEDNALYTELMIYSELCNARLTIKLRVMHFKKELQISPEIYWHGGMHLQSRLHLGLSQDFASIYYATPCAVAEQGRTMSELKTYALDEVCNEIYGRYRDVQGWYAAEGTSGGVSVASDVGTFDFNGVHTDAILFKNVFSCGDLDYVPANEGKLSWNFSLTSYEGSWKENKMWRNGWQCRRPVVMVKQEMEGEAISQEVSYIKGLDAGILVTAKQSDLDENTIIARIISSTPYSEDFSAELINGWKIQGEADLMENLISDKVEPLKPWEIKTLLITS